MTTILIDGFDDYGTLGSDPTVEALMNAGGWTYGNVYTTGNIVAGINGEAGYAFNLGANALDGPCIFKGIGANYSRLIGGFRFSSNLLGDVGFGFLDSATYQCCVVIKGTSGFIQVIKGYNGAVLQQSSVGLAANTVHYIEFDVTFNSGSLGGATVWLDGVQIINCVGTTQQSGNNYANLIGFINFASASGSFTFDDFYLFAASGSVNNAALLSNPIVLTQFPIGDSQKQFTNEGNIVGTYHANYGPGLDTGANSLTLIAIKPTVNCTIDNVLFRTGYTEGSGSGNFKGCLYSDSGGLPSSLLTGGSNENISYSAGTLITLPLTTPTALTANTQYWIGFINDTEVHVQEIDGATSGTAQAYGTVPFSSGPPSTPSGMSYNLLAVVMFGGCTGAASNYVSVDQNPPPGDISSVGSATAGISDLYLFSYLPVNIVTAYAVSVRANARLSVAGSHTFSLETKSGTTTSTGSSAGQALTTSYAYYESVFDVDPNTSAAWTINGVNNSVSGMKVAS